MECLNMKKTLLLASAACLLSLNAQAAECMDPRPYVGLDYSYVDAGMKKINGTKWFESKFNTGSANVGLNLNRYFGVEAFYQLSQNKTKRVGESKGKMKFDAYGLDLMGYMPVYEKLDLVGTLGLAEYKFKGNRMHPAGQDKYKKDGIGIRMGGGLQYNFTDHIALRALARYNWVDISKVNHIAEFSAGLRYTF